MLNLRPAKPADVAVVFGLIQALAEYEKLSHAVTGNADALAEHLFGSHPYAEVLLVEYSGQAVGFALFFHNYSTVLTQPGIYLEDLFVLPEYRRQGIGKVILANLARLALERDCGQLEWCVLDWNETAIAFYRRLGALVREDVRLCRVSGNSLTQLASSPASPKLRSPVLSDIPVLFRWVQAKAELNAPSHALTGNADAFKAHLFSSRPYVEATLAEAAGQVVGFALFSNNYSTFLTKPGIHLDLFVLPEYQQQGIEQALLSHLAQLAVRRGFGRLEWIVAHEDEPAVAGNCQLEASVLADWRLCQVVGEALTRLATGTM